MEKVWKYLKSMKFGLILLGLICAVSVIGSLIPQNAEPMTYVRAYPNHYGLIFSLQLDHVFTSWYFIAVTVLLCLNLTFCSIVRFRSIVSEEEEVAKAARVRSVEKTDPETDGQTFSALFPEALQPSPLPDSGLPPQDPPRQIQTHLCRRSLRD